MYESAVPRRSAAAVIATEPHSTVQSALQGRAAPGPREGTTGALSRLARQPFIHFVLLGALVFAAHRLVVRQDDSRKLVVSTQKQRELTRLFEQRQGRAPTEHEQAQAVERYAEDEAMFREGQ